ncbi:hypothetical protein KSP39_PZI024197 [Platanthera zijinensis]|uniref:Retrovirus-related Pol polyprotein from transposon TNT 1-94-like beta-barrel domain-containing protein n=1 Tax=Platanthera zijinensis TaxID=2320716 RepID=A0AAP0FU86_9ASPA
MVGKNAILDRFSVEKFDGSGNFSLWQIRVKDMLVQQGLIRVLRGRDKLTTTVKDAEWKDLDEKATSTIRMCVADQVLFNIGTKETAVELWEKLERLYLAKSVTTRLLLKQRLYALKMQEGGNLQEHFNVFNGLLSQLHVVGSKVEEEDKALLLLTSLPASYKHMVTMLLYGKDTVGLEEVTSAMLSSQMLKDPTPRGDQILVAHERGRSFNKGSSSARARSASKKAVTCYHCRQVGYNRRNCPQRAGSSGTSKDVQDAGMVTLDLEGDDGFYCVTESQNDSDSWILDSGASQHICSDAAMFSSLEVTFGSVFLGDDSACKVTGIGTVNLRTHDGAMRRLDQVHLVPKLRRNLISLGRLDSSGCSFAARDGVLTVRRGRTVLMRALQHGSLYRLLGTTMRGGVPMISAADRGDNRGGAVDRLPGTRVRRVSFCDPVATTFRG